MKPKQLKNYKKLLQKMQNWKGFIENYANEEENYKTLSPEEIKQFKKLLIKK